MRLAQMGLFGVIALIVVLMVLRPAALRLATSPAARLAAEKDASAADGAPLLDSAAAPVGLLSDESMIQINQVEGAIRASSIRRIAELVDKHPDESVAILRGWIAQEAN